MCLLCQSWTLTPGCLEVRGQRSRLQVFVAKTNQLVLRLSSMCMPGFLTPPIWNMEISHPYPFSGFTAGMKLKLITDYQWILESPWDTGLILTNLKPLCRYYSQNRSKHFFTGRLRWWAWQLESHLSGGVKKHLILNSGRQTTTSTDNYHRFRLQLRVFESIQRLDTEVSL